jgi:serine acetyltransferase
MWQDPYPQKPLPFWETAWLDVITRVGLKEPETLRGRVGLVARCLVDSGFRCGLNYRLAYSARAHFGVPGKLIAGTLFWWNRHWYNCAITATARIHGGLSLPHPSGISIGPGVVIGPNAWIFQNVVIAGSPTKPGMPVIGSNAAIFTGAVITGPAKLGDHVFVGANAVVARNVESRVFVRSPDGHYMPLALLGLLPKEKEEDAEQNGA